MMSWPEKISTSCPTRANGPSKARETSAQPRSTTPRPKLPTARERSHANRRVNCSYTDAMARSGRGTATGMIPSRRRVKEAALPTWIKPELAVLVKAAPEGSDWLHEMKLDGYRMHARLEDRGVN